MRAFNSLVCSILATACIPATALAQSHIVISNDDGLTSNVVALYNALKANGHDVIVSVPCTNQSGMGAAIKIGHPLPPLAEACLNDAAQPGDPGAGPMTNAGLPDGDFFYVDGTPIMALLYGLDVVGKARWGAAPDLVLSGPNEGQNVGAIVISSGTVSNAQFAALRDIPAIALSGGANSAGETLDNTVSRQIADRSVELVDALEGSADGGPLLPEGMALNVNFPDEPANAGFRVSRIGTYNAYRLSFTANMAESATPTMRAMAEAGGHQLPPLPGISFGINADAPTAAQTNDESVVYRTHIAVSPMQAGFEYSAQGEDFLLWQLDELLLVPTEAAR